MCVLIDYKNLRTYLGHQISSHRILYFDYSKYFDSL